MTFRSFLKKHERLLSAIGAGLVLLTFVVREAVREDLRDLISSIESAQSIYLVRSDTLDVTSRLVALDSRIAETTSTKIALGPFNDLRRAEDADDWTYIRLNSTLANVGELIDRFPKDERHAFTDRLIKLKSSAEQIDAKYPEFDSKISSSNPTEEQKQDAAKLLMAVEGLLSDTYQGSFRLERDVLARARELRDAKKTIYTWCTWVSYITYPLGWLIGFVGAVVGVKGLASGG